MRGRRDNEHLFNENGRMSNVHQNPNVRLNRCCLNCLRPKRRAVCVEPAILSLPREWPKSAHTSPLMFVATSDGRPRVCADWQRRFNDG
jgi:hypothetical protein